MRKRLQEAEEQRKQREAEETAKQMEEIKRQEEVAKQESAMKAQRSSIGSLFLMLLHLLPLHRQTLK